MKNELDLLTKKYWGRFAIVALVNAAIFTTYRLYIHKLNQETKKKNLKEKDEKINIPVKLAEKAKEQENIFKKPSQESKKTKVTKKASSGVNMNTQKETSKITKNVSQVEKKRTVGRPKRPTRVAPHIQKEKNKE